MEEEANIISLLEKANKYIIPIGDSQKYLLGVRGLMSEWGQFL